MKHKKYYLLEKNRDKDEFIKKTIMISSADSEDVGRRILEKSNMVELKEGYKEFSLVTYSSVVSCICNLGHIVRGSNYREYIEWEELPHRDELNVTRTVWMIDGKPEDIHYIDIDEEDIDELGNYNWLQPKEIELFESVGKVQENVEVSDQIIENTKKVKPSIIESGKCDGLMPGDEFRNLVIKNFSNVVSEVSTYKVPYYELVLEKDGIRFSVSGIAIDGVTYYTTNFPDEMYLSDSERDEEWDDLHEECYNPYTKTEQEIKKGIEPSEKILYN